MPCCQGFTLEIDGGPVVEGARSPQLSVRETWASQNFDRIRKAHRERTWDKPGSEGESICRSCAVTKVPTPIEIK